MSTVVNLKGWITLDEAARRLSDIAGEPLTEGDVLDLAVRKQTRLAVWFERTAWAKQLVGESLPIALLTGIEAAGWTRVEGIWFIPEHLGSGHEVIRALADAANGRKQAQDARRMTPIYLERDGWVFVLYNDTTEGPFDAACAHPARALPVGSRFVMTSAAFQVLATALAPTTLGKQDRDNASDDKVSSDPPMSLKVGRNRRSSVDAWVSEIARELYRPDDTTTTLGKRIVSLAERHGYESDRGPISLGSVLTMLPPGITGPAGRRSPKTRKT